MGSVRRKDIAVLKLLPPSIVSKLNEELYVPVIKHCPFFFQYGCLNFASLCHICDSCMSEAALTVGERAFAVQKYAEKVYFLTAGKMEYDHKDIRLCSSVEKGEWVSEPALWMKWYHCGSLDAVTSCQIVELSTESFRKVSLHHSKTLRYTRSYVRAFRDFMLGEEDTEELGTWRTDIWLQEAELCQIAYSAATEMLAKSDVSPP